LSQIFKAGTAGPIPPTVATSYVTDVNSPAIPAANVLNVPGNNTTINNVNGIQTDGSSGSNTLTVELTNRLQGSITTVGIANGNIVTFTPPTIGTYAIEFRIAAYNTTSLLGAGYSLFGAIRFDGVNSNLCDLFDPIDNEEGTMTNTGLNVIVSGSSTILQATGYLGQTINWSAVGLYTFIGA
jgi:hypothetical protein